MTHPFDGYRIYNGCPDSTLQAKWDYIDARLAKLRETVPEAKALYYPMEGKWLVYESGSYRNLCEFCDTKLEAIEEALGAAA